MSRYEVRALHGGQPRRGQWGCVVADGEGRIVVNYSRHRHLSRFVAAMFTRHELRWQGHKVPLPFWRATWCAVALVLLSPWRD